MRVNLVQKFHDVGNVIPTSHLAYNIVGMYRILALALAGPKSSFQ